MVYEDETIRKQTKANESENGRGSRKTNRQLATNKEYAHVSRLRVCNLRAKMQESDIEGAVMVVYRIG